MKNISHLDLAAGHLNVSVGDVLSADQLAAALRAGSTHSVSPVSAALIHSLFAELDPTLIMQCALEANADIAHVHQLYRETLSDASPRVKEWEQSVEHFL